MKYSISRNGQVLGSYSEEEVRGYIQAGRIVATDYALPEGGTQWVLVSQLQFSAAAPSAGSLPPPTPGQAMGAAAFGGRPEKPKNHLVGAILVTLFCCLPLGIAAIVFAAQVDSKYNSGDYAGATESSKKAAMFSWISFGLGLVGVLIYVVLMAVGAAASA